MVVEAVTYERDKKNGLRGMLAMYQAQIDAKNIEDPPFDKDQIAAILVDDIKELELVEAKFLLSVCNTL
jgi:hypothetical protein